MFCPNAGSLSLDSYLSFLTEQTEGILHIHYTLTSWLHRKILFFISLTPQVILYSSHLSLFFVVLTLIPSTNIHTYSMHGTRVSEACDNHR